MRSLLVFVCLASPLASQEAPALVFRELELALSRPDVAVVDDLDGDGIRDLVVGAPDVEGSYSDGRPAERAGVATVYSGATGETLRVHEGSGWYDRLGTSVCDLGSDLDGDGIDEYVVSMMFAEGELRVFGGGTGALLATLAAEDANANVSLGGVVTSIGDVDGDGYRDLVSGGGEATFAPAAVLSSRSGATLARPGRRAHDAFELGPRRLLLEDLGEVSRILVRISSKGSRVVARQTTAAGRIEFAGAVSQGPSPGFLIAGPDHCAIHGRELEVLRPIARGDGLAFAGGGFTVDLDRDGAREIAARDGDDAVFWSIARDEALLCLPLTLARSPRGRTLVRASDGRELLHVAPQGPGEEPAVSWLFVRER